VALPGPQPPTVALTAARRRDRAALAGAQRTPPPVALRARLLRAAAAGVNTAARGRALGVAADTARRWRPRWLGLAALPPEDSGVAARLADAPRPGGPCRLTALAGAAPAAAARPSSHRSGRELADAAGKRGSVDRRAARHAGRRRNRGRASPTASAPG